MGVMSAVLASVTTGSLTMAAGPAGASATPLPSAAQVATEYLNALGPANVAIVKALAALKALPLTATLGQVLAIVAPLKGKIAVLETLFAGAPQPGPTPTTGDISLNSLGAPVGVEFWYPTNPANPASEWGVGWNSFAPIDASAGSGCYATHTSKTMTMAGQRYTGLQLTPGNPTSSDCSPSLKLLEFAWHFGNASYFTGDIGLDTTSQSTSVTMGFVSVVGTLDHPSAFKPVPFSEDGTPVPSGNSPLASGEPTSVRVDLAGIHQLTVLFLVNGANPIIDFANGEFVH